MRTFLALAVAYTLCTCATADAQMEMEPYKGSAEFEQIKSLIGVWEGEMPMKKGKAAGDEQQAEMPEMMKMIIEYRLTAGGSVIQETINSGSPMEMVTMYHDRGGQLSLTHYCMLGNQPRMDFTGTSDGKLNFAFSKENTLDKESNMFMNSLALSIVDANNIVQRWTMYQGGELQPANDMQLTRVQ